MEKTRSFRFMVFMTYLPLPLLGIIVIFGVMGKMLNVGWLESAPGVLNIPMLIAYFLSLFMGSVYGFLKKEESVYMMAFIAIGLWVIGIVLSQVLTFSREIMIGINVILIAAFLVLHVMQYLATKKWEARLAK
ncbi:MAG: hypothetical protein GY841_21875 [FCB group bacterium]|nr:hypothetical protein [FCB group bacterium]